MYKKTKKAFTLVELIIVIAIIAILAVSAFLVLTKWIAKSRDSKRISDTNIIQSALEVRIISNKTFSEPIVQKRKFVYTDAGDTKTISYQWKFDEQLKKALSIWWDVQDPSDKTYYTYSVDITKTQYSILSMMEWKEYNLSDLTTSVNAIDYSARYPRVEWHKIWVFIRGTDKLPAEDVTTDSEQDLSANPELVWYMTSNDKILSGDFVLLRWGGDATDGLIWFYPFLGTDPLLDRSLWVKDNLSWPAWWGVDGKIWSWWNWALSGANYISTNLSFTVMLRAKAADGNLIRIWTWNNTFGILWNFTNNTVIYYASGQTEKVVFSKQQSSQNRIHIAMVVTPSTDKVKFYLNGDEIADRIFKEDVSIGWDDKILVWWWWATIDEIRVYDKDLSSQDIRNIYYSEK